jgi:hypothetical protein
MKEQFLQVTMPDGTKWNVPVDIIARNRAAYYADEFGGDVERSLRDDTLPLFESSPQEIHDWASSNMDWRDVSGVARKVHEPFVDYQEGWINGRWKVLREDVPSH